MITTVTGKNQITIPTQVARKLGVRAGSKVDWQVIGDGPEIRCIVLPDPTLVAASLRGKGRKFLKAGQDPIRDLIQDRRYEI